jgi:hypothetical protein
MLHTVKGKDQMSSRLVIQSGVEVELEHIVEGKNSFCREMSKNRDGMSSTNV